jgi:hypothetical protein
MQYNSYIDNSFCLKHQLTIAQGALFDLFTRLHSWSEEVVIDGNVYWFISRTKVLDELPLVYTKTDTVYRHFKSFDEKGLIEYVKHQGKDCVRLTSEGKLWNRFGNESEQTRNEIRTNSEMNPTYNTTIYNTTNNKEKNIKKNFVSDEMVDEIYQLYPTKCPTRGASTNKSTKHKDKIKNMLYGKTEEQVEENFGKLKKTIEKYTNECKNNTTWMKAFTTFLNNLPDYGDELDKEVVKNDNGDAIPSELPLVNNRSELSKEYRGIVMVNGEKWWFDMVSNSWIKYDK